MILLKFQHRKKKVIVTTGLYIDGSVIAFTVSHGGYSLGYFSFGYYFDPDLLDNPTDDFLRILKTLVKSYIDVQLYGSIS